MILIEKDFITNHHGKLEEAYMSSDKYLTSHQHVLAEIRAHIRAYRGIDTLMSEPTDRNCGSISMHFEYPYCESYLELENSFELSLHGFYRHSFIALRSILELGLFGLLSKRDDESRQELQQWVDGELPTPGWGGILKGLSDINGFDAFSRKFSLKKRIEESKDTLHKHVHIRGFNYGSIGQTLANFNQFVESSFLNYVASMKDVVSILVTTTLLKYPIGMQSFPLWRKFDGTPPGLLSSNAQKAVFAVLSPTEKKELEAISKDDPLVLKRVKEILAMPDLD